MFVTNRKRFPIPTSDELLEIKFNSNRKRHKSMVSNMNQQESFHSDLFNKKNKLQGSKYVIHNQKRIISELKLKKKTNIQDVLKTKKESTTDKDLDERLLKEQKKITICKKKKKEQEKGNNKSQEKRLEFEKHTNNEKKKRKKAEEIEKEKENEIEKEKEKENEKAEENEKENEKEKEETLKIDQIQAIKIVKLENQLDLLSKDMKILCKKVDNSINERTLLNQQLLDLFGMIHKKAKKETLIKRNKKTK
ncbi:hypothetical protein M0813_07732 [Anaeramoeba flamelloides]|uniref:Uncharacterized protein n=1 Tax=Anaeramoeba flamelloides TaxID=1746091 RepID=A0ABQ8XCZ8_9EUKA|nr:hypothetical protein M0813_07732 [Anaeramoeba flamelloides]